MYRVPATLYTKVLALQQPTITKQQLREQSSQPLTHRIHKAQLKLFGHVLRAAENCLERNCCFAKSFLYRGGVVGSGIRRGWPRLYWAEQCAMQAWHALQNLQNPPSQRHPQFPFVFFQLHRIAVHRQFGSRLVGLPTCRNYLQQTCFISFSQ